MEFATVFAQAYDAITRLAPLSVVVAALGLLHTFQQARVVRRRNEAIDIRKILNQIGVKAYLLNWSLVGNSTMAAAVLQIRESIEARIGKRPSLEDLVAFISDQLLFEAVVEKALRDSNLAKSFQLEALEFGKLRADLGSRVPLVDEALREIDTHLRLLFMISIFIIDAIRKDQASKEFGRASQSSRSDDAMTGMHRLLLRATEVPDGTSFSAACTFLEMFSNVVASSADNTLLDLAHRRKSHQHRLQDWLGERRSRRLEHRENMVLVQQLKEKAPAEFPMLVVVANKIMHKTINARANKRVLLQSKKRILHAFRGDTGSENLGDAAADFLAGLASSESDDLHTMSNLLHIRSLGVDDPDIDFRLALGTGVTALFKSAIGRGANRNVTVQQVLARHQKLLGDLAAPRAD